MAKIDPNWQDRAVRGEEVSEAFSARFGFVLGEGVKPITEEKLAQSRVKRGLAQARRNELVAGPEETSVMPVPSGVVSHYRTPKHYMDEMLKYLPPEQTGPQLAELFNYAVEKRDKAMLSMLLPYVLGPQPKETASAGVSGLVFGELLEAIREPVINKRKAKRAEKEIEVEPEQYDAYQLPEETEDE